MRKKLKIGDEVYDISAPETRGVVTKYDGEILYVLLADGSCGEENPLIFRRTGRRFKLKNILKELR